MQISWQHQVEACINCGPLVDEGHEQAAVRCKHGVRTKNRAGYIATDTGSVNTN